MNQQAAEPLAVDLRGAGGMLGCSAKQVRKNIETGALRAFRLGREWRVRVEELRSFMARAEKAPRRLIVLPPRGERGQFARGADTPLLEASNGQS